MHYPLGHSYQAAVEPVDEFLGRYAVLLQYPPAYGADKRVGVEDCVEIQRLVVAEYFSMSCESMTVSRSRK